MIAGSEQQQWWMPSVEAEVWNLIQLPRAKAVREYLGSCALFDPATARQANAHVRVRLPRATAAALWWQYE